VFFPYFAMRVRYDTINAAAGLAGTSIRVPPLPDYFDRLMDFAVAADWGRAQPERRATLRGPLPALVTGA
jgi:hypothetical protein